MNKKISFSLCVFIGTGAFSVISAMENPLSQNLETVDKYSQKSFLSTSKQSHKIPNISLEKNDIIDMEINKIKEYIKLTSSPSGVVKKLYEEEDINNYESMIEDLKKLKDSIPTSISEREINQQIGMIQEKYFPEDDW